MKNKKEIVVGSVALIAFFGLYFMYNFLKGESIFERGRTFYAKFDDVAGLGKSSPVFLNGLEIGRVKDIRFISPTNTKLLVEVKISQSYDDILVGVGSYLEIFEPSMISDKAMRLIPVSKAPLKQSGDSLVGKINPSLMSLVMNQMSPVKTKLESALSSADYTLMGINKFTTDQNALMVQKSLEQLHQTILKTQALIASVMKTSDQAQHILANNQQYISSLLNNANKAMVQYETLGKQLNESEIKATVGELKTTIGELNRTVNAINQGQGTLGQLAHNKELYDNLNKSSIDLQKLLTDMRERPNRYVHFSVFGGGKKKQDIQPQIQN